MIPGKKIILAGKEYVLPPLTLGQLRNGALELIKEHDKIVTEGNSFDSFEIRGKIVVMALQRNYPDLTEEKAFNELLDMKNVNDHWLTCLGSSGLTPGEELAAAKTQENPSGTSDPSTGS